MGGIENAQKRNFSFISNIVMNTIINVNNINNNNNNNDNDNDHDDNDNDNHNHNHNHGHNHNHNDKDNHNNNIIKTITITIIIINNISSIFLIILEVAADGSTFFKPSMTYVWKRNRT